MREWRTTGLEVVAFFWWWTWQCWSCYLGWCSGSWGCFTCSASKTELCCVWSSQWSCIDSTEIWLKFDSLLSGILTQFSFNSFDESLWVLFFLQNENTAEAILILLSCYIEGSVRNKSSSIISCPLAMASFTFLTSHFPHLAKSPHPHGFLSSLL